MESLSDLGISTYEARAYRGLLALGSGTAKAVSGESDIPMGRVYDVLNGLESRGLVRVQNANEPKRYAPVEPDVAVDRLIDTRRRELRAEIEAYEAGRDDLVERLDSIRRPTDRFWTATVGPDETVELLLERIECADDQLIMVAESLSGQFDDEVGERTLDSVLAALKRDVDVSLLLSPRVLEHSIAAVGEDRAALALDRTSIAVRVSEQLHGNFHVIDRQEVCIELSNPLAPEQLFGMVDVRDEQFAERVSTTFRDAWADAEPILEI